MLPVSRELSATNRGLSNKHWVPAGHGSDVPSGHATVKSCAQRRTANKQAPPPQLAPLEHAVPAAVVPVPSHRPLANVAIAANPVCTAVTTASTAVFRCPSSVTSGFTSPRPGSCNDAFSATVSLMIDAGKERRGGFEDNVIEDHVIEDHATKQKQKEEESKDREKQKDR